MRRNTQVWSDLSARPPLRSRSTVNHSTLRSHSIVFCDHRLYSYPIFYRPAPPHFPLRSHVLCMHHHVLDGEEVQEAGYTMHAESSTNIRNMRCGDRKKSVYATAGCTERERRIFISTASSLQLHQFVRELVGRTTIVTTIGMASLAHAVKINLYFVLRSIPPILNVNIS